MNKKKRCCGCKKWFPVDEMIKLPRGHFHSIECATEYAYEKQKKAKEKAFKKETRERKKSIKSKGQWAKEAQQQFNRYIRLRDRHLPCISCGRDHQGQYHAGHYRTVGANPELRFCTDNVHKQCSACNNHLSGNITNYRINLFKKIGSERLEWLEGPHEPKKYTIEDLKCIKERYKKLADDLDKQI